MFRALYEQFGEDYLNQQKDKPTQSNVQTFPWPATFQGSIPKISKEDISLSVIGRNQSEKVLNWKDLTNLKKAEQHRRIISPQGWTYKAKWGGVLLKSVLPADIPAQAEMINLKQTNLNGESFIYPLSAFLNQDALLCYEVNDTPLPAIHGGPLWLMVFDRFFYIGQSNLKQLELLSRSEDIEWQLENENGNYFWMKRQYNINGNITPGNYYAFDLKEHKPVNENSEITTY